MEKDELILIRFTFIKFITIYAKNLQKILNKNAILKHKLWPAN